MRDLFDDFMDELRKREAAARGEDPGPEGQRPPDPDDDDDDRARPDDEPGEGGSGRPDDDADDDAGDATDDAGGDRPETITDARRRRGRPRRRGPGGPDDGAGNRAARAGRRLGIALLILALLGIFLLFSVGIDLWTDVLWYASVGFDPVFWTRLTATVGLGIGAFLVALVVLLGNLWLAGRLSPPPSAGGGTFRSLFDRLNEAAQAADSRRDSTRSPFGGGRDPFGNVRSTGPPIVFETTDMPDLRPLAGWILGALALFFAIIIGGSVSGAWETVLLWIHRVPFSPTASVTDPIFHRDISFFLFELPFLRLVQGVFNGIVVGRPPAVADALHRQRLERRARVHLAGAHPSGGPRRPVPAVGGVRLPARQARPVVQHARRRGRRELHRPERAVPGLRRADRHLRDRRGAARRGPPSRACSGRWG